jgi:hypothetical protein
MSIEQFYTVETANNGVKVMLSLPSGEESEHWLLVRGIDSDAARIAIEKHARESAETAKIENDEERAKATRELQRRLIADFVIGWSFDKPFDRSEIERLFKNAPHILADIDKVVSNRSLFFKIASDSWNSTPKSNLGSTKSRKVRPARSGKA